jgi:hypothetical protein
VIVGGQNDDDAAGETARAAEQKSDALGREGVWPLQIAANGREEVVPRAENHGHA